jgi:ATP synthase F1 gamma subunit
MDNIQQIKSRIGNISGTRQITQSMRLVASAKVKRVQARLIENRRFLGEAAQLVLSCASAPEARGHPYVGAPGAGQPPAVIVVCGDRGLCGGYNVNLCRHAYTFVRGLGEAKLYTVGVKARDFFRRRRASALQHSYTGLSENPFFEDAEAIAARLIEEYRQGAIGAVYIVYTKFAHMLSQTPKVARLLPLDPDSATEAAQAAGGGAGGGLAGGAAGEGSGGSGAGEGSGGGAGSGAGGSSGAGVGSSAGGGTGSGSGTGSGTGLGASPGAGLSAGADSGSGAGSGSGASLGGAGASERLGGAGAGAGSAGAGSGGTGGKFRSLTRFEPSEPALLDAAVPFYVSAAIFGAMLESSVCEQSARIAGMDTAVKNSEDIIESLTIAYNQARQGAITDELTEILSGAKAVRRARQKT